MVSGTRLGYNGPKGTYKINIKPKPKYLFEILADTLKKENKRYNTEILWYIMTSKENNEQTVNFFKENKYFEYPKDKIKIFTQNELPLIGIDGEFLLDEEGKIKFASDGNGSIYKSMKQKGIIRDMKQNGVKWVYISSVDNILLKMVEPILLGLTIKQNNQIGSKTIVKRNAKEKVGVFCSKNGRPSVIEYTEIPKDMLELKNKEGELIYSESHIMCNLFSIEAIEKISKENLPYHIAFKKQEYYKNGKLVKPEKENAYKFETFIFDSFSMFNNITLLRGKREEDFAPVKNKTGSDSPITAIELYNNYFK